MVKLWVGPLVNNGVVLHILCSALLEMTVGPAIPCDGAKVFAVSRRAFGAAKLSQLYIISDTQVALYNRSYFASRILGPWIHIFQKDGKAVFPVMQGVAMSKDLRYSDPRILLSLHPSSPCRVAP